MLLHVHGSLTYVALLVFVTPFDFIIQMMLTKLIVTTTNSRDSRPTTIPRAMLAPLEEEAWLLHSVVLPSVCNGVMYTKDDWVTATVVYTVDIDNTVDISTVLGEGHEVMGVISLGVEQGRQVISVGKMEE